MYFVRLSTPYRRQSTGTMGNKSPQPTPRSLSRTCPTLPASYAYLYLDASCETGGGRCLPI